MATMTGNLPETMTVKEAARMLGISTMSVRRAVERGEIRARRVGARILILRRPILRLLELNSEAEK